MLESLLEIEVNKRKAVVIIMRARKVGVYWELFNGKTELDPADSEEINADMQRINDKIREKYARIFRIKISDLNNKVSGIPTVQLGIRHENYILIDGEQGNRAMQHPFDHAYGRIDKFRYGALNPTLIGLKRIENGRFIAYVTDNLGLAELKGYGRKMKSEMRKIQDRLVKMLKKL